ncbi:hypothetical protein BDY24DRAFT_439635 [Mrakia frigida]|uniref:uncharacterized protein n=1 Tax=Mrakia frigida TaxID=29902 RepID=UPI003FCC1E01
MSIPTDEDFAAHGLHSVVLDELNPSPDRETRITGIAMLKPVKAYPLGERWGSLPDGEMKRVRFRLAPASNPAGLEHIRRNHHLATALCSQSNTLHPVSESLSIPSTPQAERPSSPSPPPFDSTLLTTRFLTASSDTTTPQWARSSFFPYIDRIVAWWEDSYGCWMVIEEGEEGEIVSLEEYWSTIMERGGKKDGMEGLWISEKHRAREEMRVYGEATEVLIQVAEILLGLNERRLALAVARSEFFHVNTNPVPLSTNLDADPLPPQVELIRIATAVQLPGFTWENLQAPTQLTTGVASVEGSPTPSSSLSDIAGFNFSEPSVKRARGPDGAAGGLYEEKLLKKHLRYLAPETVSSRRVSPVGDVFSFGVLAYELITGRKTERNDSSELDLLSDIHRHLTSDLPSPISVLSHTTSPTNEFHDPLTPTTEPRPSFLLPPRQLSDIIMKSLAKDLDERYAGVQSLLFDLRRFRDICRAEGDLSKFVVGEVDSLSRFKLPKELISRSTEMEVLEKAFQSVVGTGAGASQTEGLAGRGGKSLKVLNVWGVSGSGKSRMVEVWAKGLEARKEGPLVGFAKLDQHLRKPLSGFLQLLQSLLDRVFSDPKEDAQVWREKILHALSAQGAIFLSLISPEWRMVLSPYSDDSLPARQTTSDWELFLPGFRVWSKSLLQLFATPERPLLLILDDIQWLPVEELKLWQDIIDSPLSPFENVCLISLFRVEEELPPPSTSLLSKSSQSLKISRFGESAVSEFLASSFHWEEEVVSASILASFLWTETQGSPFYLKSLVTSMVRDGAISFSFDSLCWKVDLPSLQRHASEGIDSYLDQILVSLPENVQVVLRILSCLPSTGFGIESLADLAHFSKREVENALHVAALSGAVLFLPESRVRFTHDRNQAAAYRLLPLHLRGSTHSSIAKYLQQPSLVESHLFDAVDNELLSVEFGREVEDKDELIGLVLRAAQKAARSASYRDSSNYLEACERIVDFGDKTTWERSRDSCFFFVTIFAEVSAVLRRSDVAITRIHAMLAFCSTPLEELNLQTLVVRLLISGNRYPDAVKEATIAIRRASFDPLNPPSHLLERIPKTPAEVVEFAHALLDQPDDEVTSESQLLEAVALLIGYVGPSVYITQTAEVRKPYFSLGAALCFSSPSQLRADSSSYLLAIYSLSVCNNMESRKSFVHVAQTVARLRPNSFFFSAGIVVALLQ